MNITVVKSNGDKVNVTDISHIEIKGFGRLEIKFPSLGQYFDLPDYQSLFIVDPNVEYTGPKVLLA